MSGWVGVCGWVCVCTCQGVWDFSEYEQRLHLSNMLNFVNTSHCVQISRFYGLKHFIWIIQIIRINSVPPSDDFVLITEVTDY